MCLLVSFLDATRLPNGRNRCNVYEEAIIAMKKIQSSPELNLLSEESRAIVHEWTDLTLRKLEKFHIALPSAAWWNMELLEFYVAYFTSGHEIFFFRYCV
jgi:hypothetical protein